MIGIICFWDRAATPYLAKYEQILNGEHAPYEIIMWSRVSSKEEVSFVGNTVIINQECSGSKIQKMKAFLKWRKTVIKLINNKNYDQLIVLTTVPAVLLYFQLSHKYSNRFIFDIRDYTFESFQLFKNIVMNIVKHSSLTAISSKGYFRWLDNSDKIMINHNITVEKGHIDLPYYENRDCYNFAFVGNVRLDTQTRALLLQMGKSPNFKQYFYGRTVPGCDIEELKQNYNIDNLFLTGPFTVQDKSKIFKNVDIINCVYANAESEDDIPLGDSTPLPNRLYDAITFYRPIVASKGTYLAELVEKYNLGCSVNGFDPSATDEILQYLKQFNLQIFVDGCDRLKKLVMVEEKQFRDKCCELIKSWRLE